MTKADIVSKISDKSGIEKADVLATVEAFMTEVKGSLEQGENVYLRGFGSFIVKERKAREARNPSTNKVINLNLRYIPSFKVSKILKESVNNSILRGF